MKSNRLKTRGKARVKFSLQHGVKRFHSCRVYLTHQTTQGRVVRKSVNANPGLKVNRRSNFPSIEMLYTAYVLCSLRLFMLKTEGQTI